MAIYRHDQAQLTFSAEAGPGGYQEAVTAVSSAGSGSLTLSGAHTAGTSVLTLSGTATGYDAGLTVLIGTVDTEECETREIVYNEGTTIYLNAPLAFDHSSGEDVTYSPTITTREPYSVFIPGVYESVDTPDPEMAIEPRYFLGTDSKRDFYAAYKGQQSLSGSIGNFVLVDGRALRFPIGKVTTTPSSTGTGSLTLGSAASKGDVVLTIASHGLSVGNTIAIYDAANTSNTDKETEVRKVSAVIDTTTIRIDYPLSFAHEVGDYIRLHSSAPDYWQHEITETVDLDSVSWNVRFVDSASDGTASNANDFERRYFGGKVGSASISAEEGGLVTMSWDGVPFLGMVHNQRQATGIYSGDLPFYGDFEPVLSGDVKFPTTDPYYFSQGTVSLFGTTFARVKNFTLNINNNLQPNYYISRQMGRKRGPTEIREQQREYSLEVTLALPDSIGSTANDLSVFKQLLLEGDYGSGMQGFAVTLTFTRGSNDSITITIPDDGSAGTGGNNQGVFITAAPHSIGGESPLEVGVSMIARNLKIVVQDSEYLYP